MKIDLRTGLSERVTDLLRAELRRFPKVRAAYLYGSRARAIQCANAYVAN